jgi:hypothetical protein
MTYIQKVPGSNPLGDQLPSEFHGYPLSFQANFRVVPIMREARGSVVG